MSTIASPRDPGAPLPPRRIPSGQGGNLTPTSSTRPSLDLPAPPRSPTPTSPGLNPSNPGAAARPRNNRAALRQYYNLPKPPTSPLPAVEVTDPLGIANEGGSYFPPQQEAQSEVAASELDGADFSASAYVARMLADSGLEELVRAYARVVGETRALDAEKKALVYDNYSKLISATETIRKMRSTMDPLNPMASTLDPAIAQIYAQASSIRDGLRAAIPPPSNSTTSPPSTSNPRLRTKQLAQTVLEAPARVRALAQAGQTEDAARAWAMPRRLLVLWRDRGLGGVEDVEACIADGDAAVRGEEAPEVRGRGRWKDGEGGAEGNGEGKGNGVEGKGEGEGNGGGGGSGD